MTTASRLLLLDTNIVIFLSQAGAIGQAIDARFQLRARGDRPLLSAITLGEALAFAQFRNWGPPRLTTLRAVLREFVTVDITSRAVLERYAEIDTYLTPTDARLPTTMCGSPPVPRLPTRRASRRTETSTLFTAST